MHYAGVTLPPQTSPGLSQYLQNLEVRKGQGQPVLAACRSSSIPDTHGGKPASGSASTAPYGYSPYPCGQFVRISRPVRLSQRQEAHP